MKKASTPQSLRRARDFWAIDALVGAGLLAPADAETLRTEPLEWVATAAVERGADSGQVAAALAAVARVSVADLAVVEAPALQFVPEALARLYAVVPLTASSRNIRLAAANPMDHDAEQALAFATSRDVVFAYALPAQLLQRLDEVYRPERQIERLVLGLETGAEVETIEEIAPDAGMAAIAAAPTARLVDAMIADAVRERASDIHCEPADDGLVVRYRVDGVLREVMKVPRAGSSPVVRRIKVMGKMDVSDPLRPHDGRAMARVDGREWDLRISSVPIARLGEKVVIRLLDPHAQNLHLDAMGLRADDIATIQQLLQHREGIILVTGPTGSGKTSTLYAALDRIRTSAINVVTVEDPVEYRLRGVNQIQVSEKQGLTFAAALRSVLRQDPDVVLLGEIRDGETATTAWQAALSGHLVLSTLHTNDAATTIMRLADIGIEPFKIAAALKGVLAQRLMRRLCPECARPADAATLPPAWRPPDGATLRAAAGCEHCGFLGYRGRFAIEEIMVVSGALAEAIAAGATAERLVEAARAAGMRTLWESGLRHVWAGDTGYDELVRVVGEPAPRAAAAPAKPAAPPPPAPEPVSTAGTAPLVLVADDDPTARLIAREALASAGFIVAEASDGITALVESQRLRPALLLLDMQMPGLDGFAVLGALRQNLAGRGISVIVVTSQDDPDTESRCIELGAEDFIAKPVHPQSLLARARAVLRRVGTSA